MHTIFFGSSFLFGGEFRRPAIGFPKPSRKTPSFQYILIGWTASMNHPNWKKKHHFFKKVIPDFWTLEKSLRCLRHIQNRHPQKPTPFLCFFHQGQHIRANATAAIEMFQEGTSFGTLVAVSNCEPKLVPGWLPTSHGSYSTKAPGSIFVWQMFVWLAMDVLKICPKQSLF